MRAFSHLPAKRVAADPAGQGQLSQRGAQALGHPFQRTEPEGPATPPEDGISAAKASGVFDAVRQQFNRDDSPHFMDEDGNLRPRDESRQQDSPAPRDPRSPQFGAGAPTRPAWSAGHAAAADSSRTSSSASDNTRPWYIPPIPPEDLHPLGLDDDAAAGSHSALNGRPELNDLVYRTHVAVWAGSRDNNQGEYFDTLTGQWDWWYVAHHFIWPQVLWVAVFALFGGFRQHVEG